MIYHQDQVIAMHQLSQERGETIDDRTHFIGILGHFRGKRVKEEEEEGLLLPAGPGMGTGVVERTAPVVEARPVSAYELVLDGEK